MKGWNYTMGYLLGSMTSQSPSWTTEMATLDYQFNAPVNGVYIRISKLK